VRISIDGLHHAALLRVAKPDRLLARVFLLFVPLVLALGWQIAQRSAEAQAQV
jgi:hypothetical protein